MGRVGGGALGCLRTHFVYVPPGVANELGSRAGLLASWCSATLRPSRTSARAFPFASSGRPGCLPRSTDQDPVPADGKKNVCPVLYNWQSDGEGSWHHHRASTTPPPTKSSSPFLRLRVHLPSASFPSLMFVFIYLFLPHSSFSPALAAASIPGPITHLLIEPSQGCLRSRLFYVRKTL